MIQVYSRKTLMMIATVISFAILVTTLVSIVHAVSPKNSFSNQLSNNKDPKMKAGGTVGAIDLHLKNVKGIALVRQNKMAAYFPKTGATNAANSSSNMKLKILPSNVGNWKICEIPDKEARIKVTIQVKDKKITKTFDVRNDCKNGAEFFGKEISFPNDGIFYDKDDSGMYKAVITIEFIDAPMTQAELGGSDKYSINYNVELAGARSSDGVLALRQNDDPQQFGLRSSYHDNHDAAGSRQVQAGVIFGFPCSTDVSQLIRNDRKVRLYDADTVFGATYMWVEKNGTPLSKGEYEDGGYHVTNESAPLVRIRSWDGNNKRWSLDGSDGNFNAVTIKRSAVDVTAKYTLMILNTGKNYDGSNSAVVPHDNTLSVSIPFDSINGTDKCNYQLIPTVNPPSGSSGTVALGADISVRGHVISQGDDSDNHDWILTAHVFKGRKPTNTTGSDNTSQTPCNWKPGASCDDVTPQSHGGPKKFRSEKFDTNTYQYNTAGLEAGDWVCFVMSVRKPTYKAQPTRWAHSDMKCVGIKGNPTGTTVSDPTYSYYPNLTVTSVIKNTEGYPKTDTFKGKTYKRDTYKWRLIETKFSSRPSGAIAEGQKAECAAIQDKFGGTILSGSCKVIKEGDNLFPQPGDPNDIVVSTGNLSKTGKGPDPIGTWTCYTLSYRTNPPPNDDLINKASGDINWFRGDWDDPDSTSQAPARWGDGYYRVWVPPKYNKKGKLIKAGHFKWVGDPAPSYNSLANPYLNASPKSSPSNFKFTPYLESSCSVSGVYPKVQVQGGDLKTTGSIDTSLNIVTVQPNGANKKAIGTYGSTTEYGVLSNGVNTGMASGSGLLRGGTSQQGAWSPLTFTNNNPAAGFGNFNGQLGWNGAAPSGGIPYDGKTTFNNGDKIVYEGNGDEPFVIDHDLTYADGYETTSKIPRVIINAKNIQIEPNVKRIDAWLIADSISTCGAPRGIDWGGDVKYALGNAALRTGECNRQLIFNGPVYVNHLYLYRTGGSRVLKSDLNSGWTNPDTAINPNDYCEGSCGSGNKGRQYALSGPAEIFNLRPDVFLSSFAGTSTGHPVATTDKVTELPPRF